MKSKTARETSSEIFESLDFRVWRDTPRVMARSHLHSDVEINFVLSGEIEYFIGGKFQILREGELALFWAGMPHVLTRVAKATEIVWAVVPLGWLLQWGLKPKFVDELLRGQRFSRGVQNELMREKFLQWSDDFSISPLTINSQINAETQKIVALEVEALMRRMAQQSKTVSSRRAGSTPDGIVSANQIEKMATFVAGHYRDDITIREIATEANLHPNYAMQLFRERCGLSLWDYVLRLRISHAQYLLLTTNRTVGDIARDAGFSSESRFYAAFQKYCGCAPRAWINQTKKPGE